MWAKYPKAMNATPQLIDPKTRQPPTTNLFYSVDYGLELPNLGSTIQDLVIANTIPNSHMVTAGVLAANRAQEYGYTFLTAL